MEWTKSFQGLNYILNGVCNCKNVSARDIDCETVKVYRFRGEGADKKPALLFTYDKIVRAYCTTCKTDYGVRVDHEQ